MTKAELKKAVASYRKGLHKNETTSCMISVNAIETLIKHYRDPNILKGKKAIDGFRIYFHRPEPKVMRGLPGKSRRPIADGRGQMSIILVPTHNYNEVWKGDDCIAGSHDMFIEKGECKVFIPGGEHTGLCPKNCPQ